MPVFMAWMISAPTIASTRLKTPAEQRGAADHHRQNGVEFEPEPGIVGIRTHDVGGGDDAGERRAQAAPDIDREDHAARADPGQFARPRVAAGRLDQEAERRATDHRAGDDQHAEHDRYRRRHAEHGAVAEPDQIGRGEGDDAPLGNELRNAPARHHQDQGGDDRLDTEHRNKKTVPQPA